MKLISLLISLALIGYIISIALAPQTPSSDANVSIENKKLVPPKLSKTPNGVNEFEVDMNEFIQDAASQRSDELDKVEESLVK